jgi:hypothetical protein
VVETAGFNDRSWFDDVGHPHTGALRTIERLRRVDFGHLDLNLTIDDPKTYTMPWSVTMHFALVPDTELIEDVCDNEKDDRHLVGRGANDEKKEIQVAPEILAKYVGAYGFKMPGNASEAYTVNVSLADGHLALFGTALTAVSETEFAGLGGSIKFIKDERGAVTDMILAAPGAPTGDLKGIRKDDAPGRR